MGVGGKWEGGGQSVQTFTYKVNKFEESDVQHGDCS